MGTAYKIRCKHCGTQFDHYAGSDYGHTIVCVGCESYIESEMAIRSPSATLAPSTITVDCSIPRLHQCTA